jgi:hypothetical protein
VGTEMLGTKDLAAECSAMEKKLGTFHDADSQPAYKQVVRRTYRVVEGSELDGVTVRAEEELAASRGRRIFLQRYRLRSRNPTFGKFPPAAEWLMDTGGLCMFVGIVGIQSGPNFISGVKSEGVGLLLAGLVVTLLPMLFTLFFATRLAARCRCSATPCPTPSATRCSPSGARSSSPCSPDHTITPPGEPRS